MIVVYCEQDEIRKLNLLKRPLVSQRHAGWIYLPAFIIFTKRGRQKLMTFFIVAFPSDISNILTNYFK